MVSLSCHTGDNVAFPGSLPSVPHVYTVQSNIQLCEMIIFYLEVHILTVILSFFGHPERYFKKMPLHTLWLLIWFAV